MIEKRHDKRIPIELNLSISSLFHQDNINVENIDAPIQVVNVSRSGIGFISDSILPLNYYFNACLQLGDDDAKLFCVVKIIRTNMHESGKNMYGCEFVGLAPIFSDIFDELEKKNS